MSKRLQTLTEKRARLDAQIKDIQARERQKERKEDTRRKIIVGALVLTHMKKNKGGQLARKVEALINEYVVKDKDRALFGLAPLPKKTTMKPKKKAPPPQTRNKMDLATLGIYFDWGPAPKPRGYLQSDDE